MPEFLFLNGTIYWGRVNRNPTPENKLNAIVGVRAAYGSFLEVKGGWITSNGMELIDEYKKHRAEHIRDYGFS